jgi:Phosphate-selective porin O and P
VKRIVPSLSLLALAGFAAAEVVSDDAAKITVGLYAQSRLDVSRGSTTTGDTYSPSENAAGTPDTADFYLRRLRPSIKGTYGNAFVFQMTLAADNWGKNASATPNTTAANTVTLFDAFGGFKFVDGDLAQTIVMGKKNAWFYTGNFNAATGLFSNMRPTTIIGVPNNVGVAYMLESPMVRFGVDVLNNVGTGLAVPAGAGGDNASTNPTGNSTGEGLWYSARLELTGAGDWSSKWQESFVGKPGHGFVLGAEVGSVNHDRVSFGGTAAAPTNPGDASATVYGLEGMIHLDALTAVADIRLQNTARTPDAGASLADVNSRTWCIQAGYAMPSGISLVPVIEPAVRYAVIDRDTDNDGSAIDGTTYGAADYGNSGRQIEIGLNAYFNGHKNKLAVEYVRWTGEESGTANTQAPTANILRIQHQLWF